MSEQRWSEEQLKAAREFDEHVWPERRSEWYPSLKMSWTPERADALCAALAKHARKFVDRKITLWDCLGCGASFDSEPASREHIFACPAHPIAIARAESDALRRELAGAKAALDNVWTPAGQDYVSRERVLREREACAKIADTARAQDPNKDWWLVAFDIANEIRSRTPAPAGGAQETEHAGVAQSVERLICNQAVEGSSPSVSSTQAPAPDKPMSARRVLIQWYCATCGKTGQGNISEHDCTWGKPAPPLTEERVREIVRWMTYDELDVLGKRFSALEAVAHSPQAPDSDKPEPLTEARVCQIVGEHVRDLIDGTNKNHERWSYRLEDTQRRATKIEQRLNDCVQRLSALESQQETARGEKNQDEQVPQTIAGERLADMPKQSGLRNAGGSVAAMHEAVPVPALQQVAPFGRRHEGTSEAPAEAHGQTKQEGDVTATPSSQPENELADKLSDIPWIRVDDDVIPDWNAVAREARWLLAPQIEVFWKSAEDAARSDMAACAERDTLRARVAELKESCKNLEAAARAKIVSFTLPHKPELMTDTEFEREVTDTLGVRISTDQLRRLKAKLFTPAKPARRITARDVFDATHAMSKPFKFDSNLKDREELAFALNQILSSRGDDKPQARTIEGE